MHHLIERSIQKYRLMNGPLRCLAACDPCGIRSENRDAVAQPDGSILEKEEKKAEIA